jgi:hypothetical protein
MSIARTTRSFSLWNSCLSRPLARTALAVPLRVAAVREIAAAKLYLRSRVARIWHTNTHGSLYALIAALAACTAARDQSSSPTSPSQVAQGEIVSELDKAIWHVFQAKNGDYWFGSHDQGAYRYDGKTLVKYTTKDGLSGVGVGGFPGRQGREHLRHQ